VYEIFLILYADFHYYLTLNELLLQHFLSFFSDFNFFTFKWERDGLLAFGFLFLVFP